MIILAVAFVTLAQQAPEPPYKRVQTVGVFQSAYSPEVIVNGHLMLTGSDDTCLAYDLRTSKLLWKRTMGNGERVGTLALVNGDLIIATNPASSKEIAHLLALNTKTGKAQWSVARQGGASPIGYGNGALFLAMKTSSVSSFDLKTHKIRWTTAITRTPNDYGSGLDSVGYAGANVLVNGGAVTSCLNSVTGKVVWTEPQSYMFRRSFVWLGSIAWIPSRDGSVARDMATGHQIWRSPNFSYSEGGCVFGGNFVGLDSGRVTAVNPKTGKTAWSVDVGPIDTAGGYQYASLLGEKLYVRGLTKSAIIDARGKSSWSGKAEESLPYPLWTDGKSIVCFDLLRLLRYQHGSEAALPVGNARKVLAQKLVARFDELDDADQRRLVALGDDAFEPLLREYIATCAKHDATKGDNYPLYSRFHDIGDLLKKVTTSKRSGNLMAALNTVSKKSSSKPLLLTLLAEKGKPEDATPYFLRELEGVGTPDFEMYESTTYVARSYISGSSDPRAVAFMLKQLENPKGDSELRYQAYVHLAGTGGDAGIKAVVAERNRRTVLRPLTERALSGFLGAGEFGTKTKPVSEKKDADGKVWGLLKSGVLGSAGDLWLAQKVNDKWTSALFLGVTTSGVSRWVEPKVDEPTIDGKTADELIKSNWLEDLLSNNEIAADVDHDGLTDLAELRLGTDAQNSDSDRDGDTDSIDPWPNAAQRNLSDAEQVLAAAFEARYHFDESEGPALFFAPEGLEPFEMVGRRGPVLWASPDRAKWSLPLERCYEQGVAFIRFGENGGDAKKPWQDRVINWNKDHTSASLEISTYFGGLNGTGYRVVVRKFGNEWLVVQMAMAYIS